MLGGGGGGGGSSAPYSRCLCGHCACVGCSKFPPGNAVSHLRSASLAPPQWSRLVRVDSGLLTQPLLARVAWGLSFFLWGLAGLEQFSSKRFFVFLSCPFPGPLARESTLLPGLFLREPVGISRLPGISAPSLRYVKVKILSTYYCVIPWVLRPLSVCFFSSTFQNLIYKVQVFCFVWFCFPSCTYWEE